MKNTIKLVATTAFLSVSSFAFCTSIQSLNHNDATKEFTDKTIVTVPLVTLDDQLVENTFTGYFNKDGKVQGQLAKKPDNGSQTDTGTWTVKKDGIVCVTWDHWNDHKATCIAIYKLKNSIVFVNQDNHKFESMVLEDNIKTGNQMS